MHHYENYMCGKVEVHIRVRVDKSDNIWNLDNTAISYSRGGRVVTFPGLESFYHTDDTQAIYKDTIAEAVQLFLTGEDVTIMAYGQTGTGKTYTMSGESMDGFIYLALLDILPSFVKLSYVEIYNERVYDLYTNREVRVYTKDHRTQIGGLHVESIETETEAHAFLEACLSNRKTNATEYNIQSSRSHTILQIEAQNALLSFIDLAGCERVNKEELRRKEGAFINKSLLALGKVICNLSNKQAVTFRDSKLTRILERSLKPKSNVITFCMISSTANCLWESLSTLQFAARLSQIDLRGVESIEQAEFNPCGIGPCLFCGASNIKIITGEIIGISPDQDEIPRALSLARKDIENGSDEYAEEVANRPANPIDIDFYENIAPEAVDINTVLIAYEKRIASLEAMVIELLDKSPDRLVSDIFILEKQMFNLRKTISLCKTARQKKDNKDVALCLSKPGSDIR